MSEATIDVRSIIDLDLSSHLELDHGAHVESINAL